MQNKCPFREYHAKSSENSFTSHSIQICGRKFKFYPWLFTSIRSCLVAFNCVDMVSGATAVANSEWMNICKKIQINVILKKEPQHSQVEFINLLTDHLMRIIHENVLRLIRLNNEVKEMADRTGKQQQPLHENIICIPLLIQYDGINENQPHWILINFSFSPPNWICVNVSHQRLPLISFFILHVCQFFYHFQILNEISRKKDVTDCLTKILQSPVMHHTLSVLCYGGLRLFNKVPLNILLFTA